MDNGSPVSSCFKAPEPSGNASRPKEKHISWLPTGNLAGPDLAGQDAPHGSQTGLRRLHKDDFFGIVSE
jgi:hypothetical protein